METKRILRKQMPNIVTERLKPMVPNKDKSPINPYLQDRWLMGTPVARNIEIMGSNLFYDRDIDWFVIINKITGERLKVTINHHKTTIIEPKG